jgi:hypothetical protein
MMLLGNPCKSRGQSMTLIDPENELAAMGDNTFSIQVLGGW